MGLIFLHSHGAVICNVTLPDGVDPFYPKSVNEDIQLIRLCADKAELVLDLIRLEFCNFSRHAYIMNRAGELADGSSAVWIVRSDADEPADGYWEGRWANQVTSVISLANNWLGLELEPSLVLSDEVDGTAVRLESIGKTGDEIAPLLRSALRMLGQSYYLVSEEASFLLLMMAIDAVCGVAELDRGMQSGSSHRKYVATIAANGDTEKFKKCAVNLHYYYEFIRNAIVHDGVTLAELNVGIENVLTDIEILLRQCVGVVLQIRPHTIAKLVETGQVYNTTYATVLHLIDADLKKGRHKDSGWRPASLRQRVSRRR